VNVVPYSLGWPITIVFVVGFFALPFSKKYNILRFAFLMYFLPSAFLYAKWTRFMAPVFPIMIIVASLWILKGVRNRIVLAIVTLIMIMPGLAYLSIYTKADVRFQASEWMYKNIPNGSYILSETANVIDLPIPPPKNPEPRTMNYKYISFDFYGVDENPKLQQELSDHIDNADYIFVLSRRVFANHTCFRFDKSELRIKNYELGFQKDRCRNLQEKYPILNEYYRKLFSRELGFTKVAEFTSYPRLEIGGHTLIEFPDEQSEETWTVFDHPVVRVYKRI
jgi:hypothetical protein